MPMTLSPFRYYQMAQYIVKRWLDMGSTSISSQLKGKGRATSTPLIRGAAMGMSLADMGVTRASLEERRTWDDMVPPSSASSSNSTAGAGPSRLTLSPPTSTSSPSPRHRDRGTGSGSNREPHEKQNTATPRRNGGWEVLRPDPRMPGTQPPPEIYRLMNDERLLELGRPDLVPKDVVVLCHGLYGFSTATPIPLFPSLKLHYWASVLEVLRDRMGANVLVVGVKGTGSVKERAEQMHEFLKSNLPRGAGVNFVAHSMGGLDCRYLISRIQPTTYKPLTLTTIGTPHHGSPFMDWCAANIGVGSAATAAAAAAMSAAAPSVAKALPYSLKSPLLARIPEQAGGGKKEGLSAFTAALTSYLLNIFDSPAYSNLTTSFLRDDFNPATPDMDGVRYTSVAGRTAKMSVLHPLWFSKLVLDAAAENGYSEDGSASGKGYEGNDGLVSVSSAKWGNFIGAVDETHHWDLRGEGGLFPSGNAFGNGSAEKKKDRALERNRDGDRDTDTPSIPGSWDWQGDFGSGVSEHLGLAADAARETMAKAFPDDKGAGAGAGAGAGGGKSGTVPMSMANSNNSKSATSTSTSPTPKTGPSNWDLQQVGQVLDWVGDFLPGDGKETKERKMADARREKEKADDERDAARSGRLSGSGSKDSVAEQEEMVKQKVKKSKFDLERFYGGLMLKLRDDGY